jgi:DNA-binding transcriptional LysR family regulator
MQPNRYNLSSDHCELLLDFEEAGSLARLAELKKRDLSVVSRQIQKLAHTQPVLEKREGRWIITPIGKQVSQWIRKSIQEQKAVLNSRPSLCITAPLEFSSRILAPSLIELIPNLSKTSVKLLSLSPVMLEQQLLNGQVDLAFDCGRPEHPSLKFKLIKKEPLSVVASPVFFVKNKIKKISDLVKAPHIYYNRIHSALKLGLNEELPNPICTVDNIASARAAAINHLGWSILPSYTIRDEVRDRQLRVFSEVLIGQETYGVWWLRENPSIEPFAKKAIDWLSQQNLE